MQGISGMETRTCAAPGCNNTFECEVRSKRKYCCSGHSRKGKHNTPEHTKKIIEAISGEKNCWFGHRGKDHPAYGCTRSEEAKEKNRKAHIGITKKLNSNLTGGRKLVPREFRVCAAPGCFVVFKCKVSSKQKYCCKGHNRRGKISGPCPEERKRKIGKANSRENNGGWRGGISKLPYPFDFDNELKNLIRTRDNYTCQLCRRTEEEEGKNLCVHHIDYIKENLNFSNLITLCRDCNLKVNHQREYWANFFGRFLKEKFENFIYF